MESIITQIEY